MSQFAFGTLPIHFRNNHAEVNAGTIADVAGDAVVVGIAPRGTAVATTGNDKVWLQLPAALAEFWLQAYVQRVGSATGDFLIFRNGTANVFRVTVPSSTTVRVDYWDGAAWQQLIAAQTLWSIAVHKIDIHLKIADAGGVIDLYVDDYAATGTPLLTFAGDTSLAGGATVDRVYLGGHGDASIFNSNFFMNVLALDDTDGRQCAALCQATLGNGTHTAWTGSEVDVDEITANDFEAAGVDFITSGSVGAKESFTVSAPDPAYASYDVLAVGVLGLGRYTGTGGEAALLVRGAAAESQSADLGLGTDWEAFQAYFANNPDTAAPWAALADAGVEIGVVSVTP